MSAHKKTEKPETPADFHAVTPSGRPFDVHTDKHLVGAWIGLNFRSGKKGHLTAQESVQGSRDSLYAGYRDDQLASSDRVAISVNADESVTVFVLHSDGVNYSEVPLAELTDFAESRIPDPV